MKRYSLYLLMFALIPSWANTPSLPPLNAYSQALASSGPLLFVATKVELNDEITRVQQLVQGSWVDLGASIKGTIYTMATDGKDLYIGGCFELTSASATIYNLARWSAGTWSPLGQGVDGCVFSLGFSGGDLYVGGAFSNAGQFRSTSAPCDGPVAEKTDGIAVWHAGTWQALGQGVEGAVYAIAFTGDEIVIGGHFTKADGGPATNVARWNGQEWSAMDKGLEGSVYALASSEEGNIYAGGNFQASGSQTLNNLALWTGESWTSLGEGLEGTVQALVNTPSGLLAGGNFQPTQSQEVTYLGSWDGREWSPVTSPLEGNITGLASSPSGTYISGEDVKGIGLLAP